MSDDKTIDDGFGNAWKKCNAPRCGLHIVRPGKVQCDCDYDPTGKMEMLESRIAELERGLKLALVYMDDDIQMLFDMERHGVGTDLQSVNQQAYEFDRLAKLIGFKSKYHPRMKPQPKETE